MLSKQKYLLSIYQFSLEHMLSPEISKIWSNTNRFDLKAFLGGKEKGSRRLVDGLDGGGFSFLYKID